MATSAFDVKTHRRDEMIDITSHVQQAVRDAGVRNGLAMVWIPHTTAGVTVNENADPSVIHDMLEMLDRLVPHAQSFYKHSEGNSAAHVKSTLVGCSTTLPITEGRLALGIWQGVFFCEFDGPRSRRCLVNVIGK